MLMMHKTARGCEQTPRVEKRAADTGALDTRGERRTQDGTPSRRERQYKRPLDTRGERQTQDGTPS